MEFWFFLAQLGTVALMLALVYRPLGDYLAAVYTSAKDLRVERGLYRLIGVDSSSQQSWPAYLRGVLAFSAVGILLVYTLQRLQPVLPYSLGLPPTSEPLAFNTAISFVTNTNWQSYSPELTLGYSVQVLGLAVQNFLSAAVGIAVAVALMRALAYRTSGTIGNFWVDLTRGTLRILLPLSVLASIVLLAGGVIQNLNGFQQVTKLLTPRPAIATTIPVVLAPCSLSRRAWAIPIIEKTIPTGARMPRKTVATMPSTRPVTALRFWRRSIKRLAPTSPGCCGAGFDAEYTGGGVVAVAARRVSLHPAPFHHCWPLPSGAGYHPGLCAMP